MNKSEQINELATALAKAQAEMKHAAKDATNPHFRSKYADLAAVVEAVREPFSKHGLSYMQPVSNDEQGRVVVETVLMHTSGQYVSTSLALQPAKNDAQSIGSCITYGRRYSLQSMAGIASDEDDDGNAAVGLAPTQRPGPAPAPRAVAANDAPTALRPVPQTTTTLADELAPWIAKIDQIQDYAELVTLAKNWRMDHEKGTDLDAAFTKAWSAKSRLLKGEGDR